VEQVLQQFLGLGVSGAVVVGFLLGAIAPKWIIDEYRVRIAKKDAIIERLTSAVERLADAAEAAQKR
jgi:hypothetical protein